jgi:hypothetical protein
MAGRLVVEQLDGETLVYDTELNEAHALSGTGAAEFLAAESEVSRREVLRKLALAGAAAAGTAALVKTIVAPSPAQAQSMCGAGPACPLPTVCRQCGGAQPLCGLPDLQCCGNALCPLGTVCCNNLCVAQSNTQCGPNCLNCTGLGLGPCCGGACCAPGLICVGTSCVSPSDRNLKHHLAPAEPQGVLAALA